MDPQGKAKYINIHVISIKVLSFLLSNIIKTIASIWHKKQTVYCEHSLKKTVSFEEQIMSKDKYPSIFSKSNGGYCVYYPSNIFHHGPSFENWGILPGHATCLDQSRSNENI